MPVFPPGPFVMLRGLAYALGMATTQCRAGDPKAHAQTSSAVWQALWVNWLLILLAGSLAGVVSSIGGFAVFALIATVITLLYPVVSFSVVSAIGETARFPAFIIAMTWLNNLRQLLVLGIAHVLSPMNNDLARWILLPVAIWMMWALWRVACQSLQRSGWVGLVMIAVLVAVELAITFFLVAYITFEESNNQATSHLLMWLGNPLA